MNSKLPRQYSPKYRIISDELRSKIMDGDYAPGETLPSQRALVSQYQVSLSTIRQSLGELAREGVVRAEPGRGFFVQQIDGAVAHLTKQRVGQIGFVSCAPSDDDSVYNPMVNGASEAAQEMGATIRYTYIKPDNFRGIERCVELAPELDGIIVTGMVKAESLHGGLLDSMKIVILGDLPDDADCELFNWVTTNGHAAGHLAVQMLLLAGHERLGLVIRPGITEYYKKLEEGFHAACRDAGLSEPAVFKTELNWSTDDDKRIANQIVSSGAVTGVVVIDDARAGRIVVCLREAGCQTPQDISVVGVGGQPRRSLVVPQLSRIDIGYRQMGAEAVRLLLKGQSDITHKALPVYVDRGETVGPPRA